MSNNQSNERKSTRYPGVYQRESRSKLFKGKPDTTYSIDYRDPVTGKRVRQTIGLRSQGITAEYANAVRIGYLAKGLKDKFSAVTPSRAKDVPTFGQAWDDYRQQWLEARNITTLRTDIGLYKYHLQDTFAETLLNHIYIVDLEHLETRLMRKGLASQTVKHVLALMRRVINKAIVWRRWDGPSPFNGFKMPSVNNDRKRYLTPYEAKALLDALRAVNERVWLMSLISLHCGLRFGEVANLKFSDIDFSARVLHIRDPKGGQDHAANMTDVVHLALRALSGGKNQLLFPTRDGKIMGEKDQIFDKVVAALEFNDGIDDNRFKVVFHTLRHTYGTWLASSGSSQANIAEMLGHKSIQMSQRYTHAMQAMKRKAAAAINDMFVNAGHQEPQQ